jgi:hypothetical protein
MRVYGGFSDDKLHWLEVDDGFGGPNWRKTPAIFKRRQEARVQFVFWKSRRFRENGSGKAITFSGTRRVNDHQWAFEQVAGTTKGL